MLREYNALRKFAAFYYAANFACKCECHKYARNALMFLS